MQTQVLIYYMDGTSRFIRRHHWYNQLCVNSLYGRYVTTERHDVSIRRSFVLIHYMDGTSPGIIMQVADACIDLC